MYTIGLIIALIILGAVVLSLLFDGMLRGIGAYVKDTKVSIKDTIVYKVFKKSIFMKGSLGWFDWFICIFMFIICCGGLIAVLYPLVITVGIIYLFLRGVRALFRLSTHLTKTKEYLHAHGKDVSSTKADLPEYKF